jgi:hypothetical protein
MGVPWVPELLIGVLVVVVRGRSQEHEDPSVLKDLKCRLFHHGIHKHGGMAG